MDFDTVEKMVESFKKKPKATLAVVVTLAIVFIVSAYLYGFFSEKGKHLASPAKQTSPAAKSPNTKDREAQDIQPRSGPPKSSLNATNDQLTERAKQDTGEDATAPRINQHTEGNQSPAIVADRDVTITYGAPQKSKTSKKD